MRKTFYILHTLCNIVELPDWVRKYKATGIEIRVPCDRYYAYEMSSKWNRGKKRSDKVTGKYLGVVTLRGILKPDPWAM